MCTNKVVCNACKTLSEFGITVQELSKVLDALRRETKYVNSEADGSLFFECSSDKREYFLDYSKSLLVKAHGAENKDTIKLRHDTYITDSYMSGMCFYIFVFEGFVVHISYECKQVNINGKRLGSLNKFKEVQVFKKSTVSLCEGM